MTSTAADALAAGEVHVWNANLDVFEAQAATLQATVSADELHRASKFYFERDRRHYIVARGILRSILASYLGTEAARIEFRYSMYGKPELAKPAGSGLHFNVSHSESVALYAFAIGRRIGIDVERIRDDFDFELIAKRSFSLFEHAALKRMPATERRRAFFVCWTRKEAYIKALGTGLNHPLHQFDVSVDEPAMLLNVRGEPGAPQLWDMKNVHAAPRYVGAVAAEGREWPMVPVQWPAHGR
jgi:4'-phosphopantetheinyl transferase